MERKIGEEFEIKLRLKVVKSDKSCIECIFNGSYICSQIGQLGDCACMMRNDEKDVHFELISCEEV